MPISGPVIHQQLMSAYSEAHQRLESARGQISHGQSLRDDLDDKRSDTLVRLAKHDLPELTAESIRDAWFEVRASLADILYRKQQHVRELSVQLNGQMESHREDESQLVNLNERLDEARDAQAKLISEVESALRDDAEFVTLSDRAAVAEAALERAEDNLLEIDQDSARKLPAYENSDLFTYLRDRDFGTSQYKHRGFTRRMDRWLANWIDYKEAKKSYDFLQKTPESMRKIIAEDRDALNTVMEELEKIRDRVADEHGLPKLLSEIGAIQSERQTRLNEIGELDQQISKTQRDLSSVEDPQGSYHREAVREYRQFLEQTSPRELRQRARETPSVTDDQIVASLAGIDAEVEDLEATADRHRRKIRGMRRVLDELGRLIQRYRAAKYDSQRCLFVGKLDVLGSLARAEDEDDVQDLWRDLQQTQRWGPSTMDRISQVATHPMTQVLINAMAHAAGAALSEHARRAGKRRRSRKTSWKLDDWSFDSSGDLFGRRRK